MMIEAWRTRFLFQWTKRNCHFTIEDLLTLRRLLCAFYRNGGISIIYWLGMKPEVSKGDADEARAFVTTRWSLIMSAANGENREKKAHDALAELCRTYWRPIFSFVCRRGYSMEDAQDLTQDFFVML